MISTPETRAHAQDILDFIHDNPEKHDQSHWCASPDKITGCGTTMCVAGTSCWLKMGDKISEVDYIELHARNSLGLDFCEAEILFYEMDNERAIQKLKKIVTGEFFSKEDFFFSFKNRNDISNLTFDSCSWEQYQENNSTFIS